MDWKPRVLVDVFEQPSGAPAALRSLGIAVEVRPLAVGDYAISTTTGVERKSCHDLQLSLAKGRFWTQMNNLRATYPSPFLLVEGSALDAGGFNKQALRASLLAVIDEGVAVVRTEQAFDSARWLAALARRRQRRARSRFKPPHAIKPKPRSRPDEAALAAIPTISAHPARALLDQFGTIAGIAEASISELRTVAGVAPKRAIQIHGAMHGGWHV